MALAATLTNAQTIVNKTLEKVAFGSCNGQDNPQNIWYTIVKEKPDVFVFVGDNIYGDTEDMSVLQKKWDMLANKPGYIELKKNTPVIGTWDDHDYGVNDGGKEYPKKAESKKIFLNFLGEPANSPRWNHEGIYTSYMYGDAGKRVQVILLDTRTFRDKLCRGAEDEDCLGEYIKCTDTTKTMLGAAQWAWLEEELKKPADLRIIGSSTQFLVDFNGWEAWINMPHERERFFKVIEKTRANGVVFISGDVHYAELSVITRPGGYPIYDLTSSGLTHGHSCAGPNVLRLHGAYMQANYGLLNIDWKKRNLTFEIRNEKGDLKIAQTVAIDRLKF